MVDVNFSNIYKQHYNRIYRISYYIMKDVGLAEDVVQETFIKAWKKSDSVQDEARIGSWLSVIARRTAIDMLRRENNNHSLLIDNEFLVNIGEKTTDNVEAEVESIFLTREIKQCIKSLQPIYREVLLLRFNHEMKGTEIARKLNIAVPTVKTRMLRARKQLLEMMEKIA